MARIRRPCLTVLANAKHEEPCEVFVPHGVFTRWPDWQRYLWYVLWKLGNPARMSRSPIRSAREQSDPLYNKFDKIPASPSSPEASPGAPPAFRAGTLAPVLRRRQLPPATCARPPQPVYRVAPAAERPMRVFSAAWLKPGVSPARVRLFSLLTRIPQCGYD
jgi:hypothetical protein